MSTKHDKLLRIASWAVWIVVVFSMLISYWLLRPYNLGEVKQELTALNNPVTGGEVLLTSETCLYFDGYRTIERRIFNERGGSELNTLFFDSPQKGCGETVFLVSIPREIPSGTWQIEINTCSKVNPVREVCFTLTSLPFEIKRGE